MLMLFYFKYRRHPNPHKIIRNSDGIIVGENVYEEDFIEVAEEEEDMDK